MSILPLSGVIGVGISFYYIPIDVQDVIYSASGGVDEQGSPLSRTIQGAIDPSNAQKLEYIFGGNVSDGDILIYTNAPLYIDDQYAPEATRKQSFVTYSGFEYRVSHVADWSGQLGQFIYLAKRHIVQSPGGI